MSAPPVRRSTIAALIVAGLLAAAVPAGAAVQVTDGTGRTLTVGELQERHDGELRVSRVQRGERQFVPARSDRLEPGSRKIS